jgi:hypothetical protein
MVKKDKTTQRADVAEDLLAARKKTEGLASYQEHYAEREKPFEIDTHRFTDSQRQEIEAEIGGYSITPKTFKSRKFFSDDEPLMAEDQERKASEIDNARAELETREIRATLTVRVAETIAQVRSEIDGLEKQKTAFAVYEQESIARFQELSKGVIQEGEFVQADQGLKLLGEKFAGRIIPLQSYATELEKFQSFIDANQELILTYQDVYANDTGNSVTRFGINVASMTEEQSADLASIYTIAVETEGSLKSGRSGNSSKKSKQSEKDQIKMLHPLEVLILQDAIDHLKDLEKKTVLVDIFARNDDNSIRQEHDRPETHSVVLYKNQNEIIVIDPSDPVFSRHLAYNNMRLFRDGDDPVDIVSPLKEKIYVPVKDHTGPGSDQFRDCTDVAVKLAFGLNKLEGDIVAGNIESLDVVREVTNNEGIGKELFFDSREITARFRQSSEDIIRSKISKLVKAINDQINIMEKYHARDIRDEAISQLSHAHANYEMTIENLLVVYKNNVALLQQEITNDEAVLIAEVQFTTGE